MKKPHKILLVHNYYQQPGGEDQVFSAECSLLERHNHRVHKYTVSNDSIPEYKKFNLFLSTVWNKKAANDIITIVKESDIDIVHFHNTFPLISPAAYYAVRSLEVPIVQTLHNYRLFCVNALFFRNGKPCEDCLGKLAPLPGIYHRCYRSDILASSTVALMTTIHRLMRTWLRQVDLFITFTDFSRNKFIQGGIPENKIIVKPNFVHPDPGLRDGNGNYFTYVGRLAPEKGIENLIRVWTQLDSEYHLRIIGDGPLAPMVKDASLSLPNIEWLGRLEKIDVISYLKKSIALVFPSTCYEGFPMVIAESFAVGVPVITNDLGSMSSIIEDNRSGFLCRPGDDSDWVNKIIWTSTHPENLINMSREARKEFKNKYSSEVNYQNLMEAYAKAIENSKRTEKF